MYVLGIVGGVASGKSAVARQFARLGAALVDADEVGHAVLRLPQVIEAFRQRWGESIVGPDGQVVRREVARRVFGDDEAAVAERKFLNEVTHPLIRDRLRAELNRLRATNAPVAVLDAALLYETGWGQLCDGVVFVDATREERLRRAQGRGWSAEQFAAREASQWPVDEKKERAKWVIENSGPIEALMPQAERVWSAIAQQA
jgi:dephospho-CoA kinase